ncbi:MAG: hypothetical protein ACLUIQ_07540 [Dialister invisus]
MRKEIWLLCLPLLLRRLRHTGKAQDPPQIITSQQKLQRKQKRTANSLAVQGNPGRRQKHRSWLRRKKNSRRLNRLLLKGK